MPKRWLLRNQLKLGIGFDEDEPYDDDGTLHDFLIDEDEYRV
jgi:hypothetical protein